MEQSALLEIEDISDSSISPLRNSIEELLVYTEHISDYATELLHLEFENDEPEAIQAIVLTTIEIMNDFNACLLPDSASDIESRANIILNEISEIRGYLYDCEIDLNIMLSYSVDVRFPMRIYKVFMNDDNGLVDEKWIRLIHREGNC